MDVSADATPSPPPHASTVVSSFRHLTRNERERCIMARVQRTGRRFYRCFGVRRHGSWEAAEAAARLWLRPVIASLSAAPAHEARPGARNRTGVVGVCFRPRRRTLKSGRAAAYPAYIARWPGAKAGVTWMFTSNGGEDGAFLRACLCRELKTADRLRVEWAVRALSPERREELLARRSMPVSSTAASAVAPIDAGMDATAVVERSTYAASEEDNAIAPDGTCAELVCA